MLKRIEEIHEDAIYCIQLSLVRKIYIDETCRMLGKRVYVHKAAPRNKKKEKSGVVYHCHDSYMSWLVSKNAVRNWASFYETVSGQNDIRVHRRKKLGCNKDASIRK